MSTSDMSSKSAGERYQHGRQGSDETLLGVPGPVLSSDSESLKTAAVSEPTIPNIIPPNHPVRTLVLCFDGTGDQFDNDNSNVVRFFSLLKKNDNRKQLCYYQSGIGTYTTPDVVSPLTSKFWKVMDEAIAWNLDSHVMGGYEFLMQNYTEGDKICIFGFSRGAYTARSLAGMIHKVGILPKCNHQQVPFAYRMYSRDDETGWRQSKEFKKAFSIDAPIEFVGVWDTVSSVGLINRDLPFAKSNTIIRTFRHAISLDERRAKFKANTWHRKRQAQQVPDEASSCGSECDGCDGCEKEEKFAAKWYGPSDCDTPVTDVEEVWFAGCHCDVGGGSVKNEINQNLARIPLRWMIRECFKTDTGIMFDSQGIREIGIDPATLWPVVTPRPPIDTQLERARKSFIFEVPRKRNPLSRLLRRITGPEHITPDPFVTSPTSYSFPTEEDLDLTDALQPLYDYLTLCRGWWILEFLPIRQRYQDDKDDSPRSKLKINLGKGRYIPQMRMPEVGVKVHRSVKMRMEAQYPDGSRYVPKAQLVEKYVTWVD